jgi:nicotinamidase-related amidase
MTGGGTALLVIDMLNDMVFEGAEQLLPAAEHAASVINTLRERAREAGVPVVYVNDHYGHWHSEKSQLIDYVTRSGAPGRDISRRLLPADEEYFVIKPQLSGFYASNLSVLLPKLGAKRLILTGIAADICVLFTAADAHMRDYELWIPADAVASQSDQHTRWALEIMRHSLNAEVRPTSELSLLDWLG